MPKKLTEAQIKHFREEGYLFPVDGISEDYAADLVRACERFEEERGVSAGYFKLKGHCCFPEVWDFLMEPSVLDAAEDILGPNILAFGSRFWIKPHRDGTFVSWHQDSAYFGAEPQGEMIVCWVALTPANRDTGCLRVMPGTHLEGREHYETAEDAPGVGEGEKKNMLGRGQTIPDLDESKAVLMELNVGQFSMHYARTAHASGPNHSDSPRYGFSFFLMPTHARSTLERRPARLVRGVDEYNNWDEDLPPTPENVTDLIERAHASNAQYTDPKFTQDA
jgi:chlorinating enzyme